MVWNFKGNIWYIKKEETKYILSSSFSLFFRFLLLYSIPARQVCHTFYTATTYIARKRNVDQYMHWATQVYLTIQEHKHLTEWLVPIKLTLCISTFTRTNMITNHLIIPFPSEWDLIVFPLKWYYDVSIENLLWNHLRNRNKPRFLNVISYFIWCVTTFNAYFSWNLDHTRDQSKQIVSNVVTLWQ